MFMRNAAIIVVGYDVTSGRSLKLCGRLIETAGITGGESSLVVAVGNKIDLPRIVVREEALSFFEGYDVPASHYFETSVKTGDGVDDFLVETLRLWHDANKDHLDGYRQRKKSASEDENIPVSGENRNHHCFC